MIIQTFVVESKIHYKIFMTFSIQTMANFLKMGMAFQDDPLNNLLIDAGFLPPGINKDSVSLSDLVSYYYPSKKIGDGVGDIKIGGTILLSGTPTWALNGKGDALYGQLFVTIPYGRL